MGGAKQKRLLYVPGMISLLLVPLGFIDYVNHGIKKRQRGKISMVYYDTADFKKRFRSYSGVHTSILPKRNYVDINLTGTNWSDKLKLDFAHLRIREILNQNDTLNGVHFEFSSGAEYWTFIKAIDMLKFERAKFYLFQDNDIWFYSIQTFQTQTSAKTMEL